MNNELYKGGTESTHIVLSTSISSCNIKSKIQKEIRIGETLKIYCKVLTPFNEGVPIGYVDYYLDDHFIQTVTVNKGYADLNYTIPTETPIGTYTLKANYRGIGRFKNSTQETTIKIVNKYTTITRYINNPIYGVAGENICLPVTVKDINGGNVLHGEVRHYINVNTLHKLGTTLEIDSVYKLYGDSKCVLHGATLYDDWGDPINCGLVNFYIGNGLGVLRATKTTIDNTYTTTKEPQRGLYYGTVIDETGSQVQYGDLVWSLRRYNGGLKTTVTLPDSQTMYKGFKDCIFGEVTDEDGLPVTEGQLNYYLRCNRACKPWLSKIKVDYAYNLESKLDTFMSAIVTDLDEFMVDSGTVDFSFNDTPLEVTKDKLDTLAFDLTSLPVSLETKHNISTASPYVKAMITDENGVVIDVGDFITEETNNGVVSTYVSDNDPNPTVTSDMVEFKLRKDKEDEDG